MCLVYLFDNLTYIIPHNSDEGFHSTVTKPNFLQDIRDHPINHHHKTRRILVSLLTSRKQMYHPALPTPPQKKKISKNKQQKESSKKQHTRELTHTGEINKHRFHQRFFFFKKKEIYIPIKTIKAEKIRRSSRKDNKYLCENKQNWSFGKK